MTTEQTTALLELLKGVPGVRAETLDREVERACQTVKGARSTEAQGGTFSPNILERAEAILRAAGIDPNSITAEVGTSGPRTGHRGHPQENELLGIGPKGAQLTVSDCAASGQDPLAYLSAEGITLTAEGQLVLAMLSDLPSAKAKALKIDVAAVDAYAKANKLDPAECLKAAIETEEQRIRDQAFLGGLRGSTPEGPAQPAPRDEQLEADEALAGRFGLKF